MCVFTLNNANLLEFHSKSVCRFIVLCTVVKTKINAKKTDSNSSKKAIMSQWHCEMPCVTYPTLYSTWNFGWSPWNRSVILCLPVTITLG